MKVLILGGDGFCGWPTALHLSAAGHQVEILDSLIRRTFDEELGVQSVTPIVSMNERLAAWHDVMGRQIRFHHIDARDADALTTVLEALSPDTVVHFAEQRSAPYSMKTPRHRRYTVENNLSVTHNLLSSLTALKIDAHVVHLGTMGVYGYGAHGVRLPEGYLEVQMPIEGGWLPQEIRFPDNPGSIYHLTKSLDQLLFAFYAKNDGLRVTDLHQGIVWGTQTTHTLRDPRLVNRFDYDGDFGTVLNRFLVQAAIGHPLTVHGVGGQMRAFIHLQDCVRCVQLAMETPPAKGERVRILNQMTEVHRILDLAQEVAKLTGASIQHFPNPRKEAEDNHLLADNHTLLNLGLDPIRVTPERLLEIYQSAREHSQRCDPQRLLARSLW